MQTNVNTQAYPFAWLDELIEITLHPTTIQLKAITPKRLEEVCDQLPVATKEVEMSLRTQIFGLDKSNVKTVVELYYNALQELRWQATQNLTAYTHNAPLAKAGKIILSVLDELHQRITERYRVYLPKEESHTFLPAMLFKLLIKLSGDQISILVKAAFQAGLIPARSLRQACRLLAPYLSTDREETLSANSLRSHASQPETPDLDIVLNYLEKVTAIVKGYYRRGRR
ncbi:hypothetical protein ACFS5N_05595 [Mucilaginibacter ximonensis]|uniref:Uncharacterized protein n=1 Tax=Mucilaginibacter ximonensis TaxID=538021 RepID=A0ABW5Y9K5_9SPHI